MSQLEELQTRPEFEAIDLAIDIDEAHRHVKETIQGLNTSESTEGKKYRTMHGMLVAIISPGSPDEGTAMFVYRTAPSSEPATRKARKLHQALDPFSVDQ